MSGLLQLLRSALKRFAELTMAALALLTFADVIGRYVFNRSVTGAVEMTEILMVGVIFTGVLLATLRREHVTIDLVPIPFGRAGARVMGAVASCIAAAVSALLAATSWAQAQSALLDNEQSTVLRLPLAPVVFFMTGMLVLNAVVQLVLAWRDLRARSEA
jgi:TRAP-type C4-dicarboxylate transport system permease small subunit